MRLEHSFEVGVPVERAWEVLLDIERIAPCMPGAALSGFDGENFTGMVKVKLGPVSLSYKGKGQFVERDEAARRVVIKASGQDSRGAGAAAATVTAQLHPTEDNGSTRVEVVSDLDISGKAAQFGRGMIGDVSSRLLGQFVDCLTTQLAAEPAPSAPPAKPATPSGPEAPASYAAPGPDVPASDAAPALSTSVSAEPEPIDLLAVSGVSGAAKKVAPYLVGVVVLALVVWALVALLA